MIKLGTLKALEVKMGEDTMGGLSPRPVVLKVSAFSKEFLELVQGLTEGEEFLVFLELVKPRLPLEFPQEEEVKSER